MRKNVKRSGLGLAGFLLFVIVINLFDQKIDPRFAEFEKQFYADRHKVKDNENAYFTMLGLRVTEDQDPHEEGLKISRKYYEHLENSKLNAFREKEFDSYQSLQIVYKGWRTCDFSQNNNCLANYRENIDSYTKVIQNNKLLLQRYKKMTSYPHFQEVADVDKFITLHTHEVYLADVGHAWVNGDVKYALDLLIKDIQFQRRALLGTQYVIMHKTVFAAQIGRDYALLSAFIQECLSCVEVHPGIADVLRSLSDEEINLQCSIKNNLFIRKKSFDEYRQQGSQVDQLIANFISKENASLNSLLYNHEQNKLVSMKSYHE